MKSQQKVILGIGNKFNSPSARAKWFPLRRGSEIEMVAMLPRQFNLGGGGVKAIEIFAEIRI